MTRQLNVDWLFDDTFLIILDAVMVLSFENTLSFRDIY